MLSQCRFTPFHILFLKVTECAFENCLAEIADNSALQQNGSSAGEPDEAVAARTAAYEEMLETALCHGLNLIAGYKKYPMRGRAQEGTHVIKVAELEFVLGNNGDCAEHLERAEKIIAASMGKECRQMERIREIKEMLEAG